MDTALYGPDGYYASGRAQSGRSGDYFTAPDVGPVFGLCLAEIFKTWSVRFGATPISLLECGAGEGALAESLRSALPSPPFRYAAVERSPVRRDALKTRLGSDVDVISDLKTIVRSPVRGILVANELIDAFAVHRVRMNAGQLEEAFVSGYGAEARLLWDAPSTPKLAAYLERLGMTLPDSYETEINLQMRDWIGEAAEALDSGVMVLIDYGRPAHELFAPERNRGTLRGFQGHQVSTEFLKNPGHTDLTSDVDFTSLALDARETGLTPLAFMELGSFLLQGAGSRAWSEKEQRGLRYLIHPEGLGGAFHVLVLGKGIDANAWAFEHNRIRRLGLPS